MNETEVLMPDGWYDVAGPSMVVAAHVTGIPGRFELVRRIGEGAYGSVFVVRDAERDVQLALKQLNRMDPGSVYRFKQEFRALADLRHPNLVRLHELHAVDSAWCFTMDFIDGVRFDAGVWGLENQPDALHRVHSTRSEDRDETGSTTPVVLRTGSSDGPERMHSTHVVDRRVNLARLRSCLSQLVSGVLALHGAGILHRDLKPSNVLVDRDGKVFVLDFGMVATQVRDSHQSGDGSIVGTPAYMSPEQARGAPLTTASDWYTVGLMLYEALVGHLPFSGTLKDMITARASRDPIDPRALNSGSPSDLCDLAMRLLSRDPSDRPSGIELARILGIDVASVSTSRQALSGVFVGRERELRTLRDAFALSRRGKTVVAQVHGPSGHGKTTLIRRFLGELVLHHEVVVLEGRCYERESVPFKAIDDLVDAFGRYLRGLRTVEAAGFLPRDARSLFRLFPSLGRLEIAADLQGRAPPSDPVELRRRAFGALREMLARISDTRPVVLFLDDVHWGDADSASLLRNLLAPPDVPAMLLIASYRGDGPTDDELLRTLRSPNVVDAAWESVDVALAPLPAVEAESLAAELLGKPVSEDSVKAIAEESGGSPLFVTELVRAIWAGIPRSERLTLQAVIADRVASLPPSGREVLELLACCERPIQLDELERASSLSRAVLLEAIDRLRDEQFVAVQEIRGDSAFEILHDKLRPAVQSGLDEQTLSKKHLCLAEAFVHSANVDPEAVSFHYRRGGDRVKAADWTEKAAENARAAVAFDRAATLYSKAMELAEPPAQIRIQERLAESLAGAGRCAESAMAYLQLSAKLTGERATELRQRAGEQYLRAGYVKEAYEIFGPLLKASGLANPVTPANALARLLWGRARLKLRGLDFKRRALSEIDPVELARIDFCWVIGSGLAGIDLVRSAHYITESLSLALKAGEPLRIVRSMSMFAIMKSLESAEGCALAANIADRTIAIAETSGHPHAMGWAKAALGVVAWGNSDLERCNELCIEAQTKLRERAQETFREGGSLQIWFGLHSQFLMGKLDDFSTGAPALIRDSKLRGDRYLLSTARAYQLTLLLAVQNRIANSRAEADAAIAVWPENSWYHQHWASMRAHCFLDLYEGRGVELLKRTAEGRPRMKKAMQLRIRMLRLELEYLEGRGYLDGIVVGKITLAEATKEVNKRIALINAENSLLGSVYAGALAAGLVAVSQPAEAGSALARAGEAFDRQGMPLHAAACLWREGQAVGGPAGEKMIHEASLRLSRVGVVAPADFANMLVPRFKIAESDARRMTER